MRSFHASSTLKTSHASFSYLNAGLGALLRAWHFAQDLNNSPWEFAVEIGALSDLGMTDSDLRWLVAKGWAEFAEENGQLPTGARQFHHKNCYPYCSKTCFVLTTAGFEMACDLLRVAPPSPSCGLELPDKPTWDAELRELRLGSLVVKRFRVPAPAQELILTVFQEEGWPRRIDDPLPPSSEVAPKDRLHETIKSLNRNQRPLRIRFAGNGEACAVIWEPVR